MSDKKILIKCLYCGKELDDTVEICHECEEKIQLFSHVSKQNKRTLIIIGMLFLLIIKGLEVLVSGEISPIIRKQR